MPFPKAEISLATQSFGQGMTATAVQMAAAYGALANDGVLMRPYLVSKVVDPDGVVLLENRPTEVRQVGRPQDGAPGRLRMLESVVTKEGTAPKAAMEDYRVAGKTGTAQKADPVARGYSDKRIASFVGMVPAEEPRAGHPRGGGRAEDGRVRGAGGRPCLQGNRSQPPWRTWPSRPRARCRCRATRSAGGGQGPAACLLKADAGPAHGG